LPDSVADALIEVGISTGVDVVTKKNVNPTVRGLGRAYRVFSLIEPAHQFANAVRIVAYTDATAIICHELLINLASRELANRLLSAQTVNYEIAEKAEQFVLSVDYARDVPDAIDYLGAAQHILESDLVTKDYLEYGRGLSEVAHESIARGVDAHLKALELMEFQEAKIPRRDYNWDREEFWLDRLNDSLGHVLWRPVPEIGLGSKAVRENVTFYGTFRRDKAEGYGCLEWKDGTRYYGQIHRGNACGYGGFRFADGGLYFGYWPKNRFKNLGAFVSPNRDRVVVGVGRGKMPNSYGRQIGLADGVQSMSGFWSDGQLVSPLDSLADTNRKIADGMWSSFTTQLKAEYESKAIMDDAKQGISDAAMLSALRPFI